MIDPILTIGIAIVFAAAGQLLLKQGMNQATSALATESREGIALFVQAFQTPAVLAGLVCYGISTLGWLLALSQYQLSFVYPMLALMHVLIPLGARIFFQEDISPVRWAGIVIVAVGVALIAQSR